MHNYLLFIALAHVIILMFRVHWPMDHICIVLAYSLAWSHAEMPNQFGVVLNWLSQKTHEQLCARLLVLRRRLTSIRPKLRLALTIDGMRVRLEFHASLL